MGITLSLAVLILFRFVAASDPLIAAQTFFPSGYDVPLLQNVGSGRFPMPLCHGIQLEEASIDDLQQHLSSFTLSTVDLLHCYLRRIEQVDPYLKSIIELNPSIHTIAHQLDLERINGHIRGPLHSIPILLKDTIATRDRMSTTAGSWALLGSIAPRDAFVVSRLRAAGALILGKAALSEWSDMRSTNYSEGYSARGGQCRSAYNLTVNPGGSSSGSAVAVGANLVPVSLGVETDGSVINPAQRNGIVGIKPTVGLTSRAGVIPESHNQDTVGTFGKTVRDAVYVLDAIVGVDERDNYTLAQPRRSASHSFVQYLSDRSALRGAIFGLPWDSFWRLGDPVQIAHLEVLISLIEEAGATVVNGTELPHWKKVVSPDGWEWDYGSKRGYANESEYSYIKVDFYNDIKRYLGDLQNTEMRSLEDLVRYNIENVGSEGGLPGNHPAFGSGQDGFEAALRSNGVMDRTYWEALEFCRITTREEGIDAALKYKGRILDGLLVPPDVAQSIQIAAQAGYPVITVPAGVSKESGMPYGLGIVQTAWEEGKLIRYSSAIEDLQRVWGRQRPLPEWRGYLARNIPVLNA